MYTTADVRKLERERDELLNAASATRNVLMDLIRTGSHIRCEGCQEDIFQATQWLEEAMNETEGRK